MRYSQNTMFKHHKLKYVIQTPLTKHSYYKQNFFLGPIVLIV